MYVLVLFSSIDWKSYREGVSNGFIIINRLNTVTIAKFTYQWSNSNSNCTGWLENTTTMRAERYHIHHIHRSHHSHRSQDAMAPVQDLVRHSHLALVFPVHSVSHQQFLHHRLDSQMTYHVLHRWETLEKGELKIKYLKIFIYKFIQMKIAKKKTNIRFECQNTSWISYPRRKWWAKLNPIRMGNGAINIY